MASRPKSRLRPKDFSKEDVTRVLNSLTREHSRGEKWDLAAPLDLPKQLLEAYEEAYLTLVCSHSRPDATVYVQIRSDGVRLFAKYTSHRLAHYYNAPPVLNEDKSQRRDYAAEAKTAYETWRCPVKRNLFV